MVDVSRLIRFILVGGSSAVLALGLTWFFVDRLHLQVILGSTIAVSLTALYNYCLHYYWTFSSDAPHGWVLVKYLLMCLGALIVNGLVMNIGVMELQIHYLIVQLLASVAVVVWSFSISSLWVFAEKS
jgi:putative flippase GtrA